MTLEKKIEELEINKDQFEDHQERFIESICEFYYKNKFLTPRQIEWVNIFFQKLVDMQNDFYISETQ